MSLFLHQSLVSNPVSFVKSTSSDGESRIGSVKIIEMNPHMRECATLKLKDDFEREMEENTDGACGEIEDPIRPQYFLYPRAKVQHFLSLKAEIAAPRCGLDNLGNTCYMNSVFQALFHTTAFRELILSTKGTPFPDSTGFDVIAALRNLFGELVVKKCTRPTELIKNLKKIARTLQHSRQEDAREFASKLLEAVHEGFMSKFKGRKIDSKTEFTTAVGQLFGGYFRSRVEWSKKEELAKLAKEKPADKEKFKEEGNTSDCYDQFTILSVEVKGATVEKLLHQFTKKEVLDKNNLYRTPSGVLVSAEKRITVFSPPPLLILQLKRFEMSWQGPRKIVHKVKFEETLNLREFCSEPKQAESAVYDLFAVIVHIGSHINNGHYVCYVKCGNWYLMDDSSIRSVSVTEVLRNEAYMLFYRMQGAGVPTNLADAGIAKQAPAAPESQTPAPAENGARARAATPARSASQATAAKSTTPARTGSPANTPFQTPTTPPRLRPSTSDAPPQPPSGTKPASSSKKHKPSSGEPEALSGPQAKRSQSEPTVSLSEPLGAEAIAVDTEVSVRGVKRSRSSNGMMPLSKRSKYYFLHGVLNFK